MKNIKTPKTIVYLRRDDSREYGKLYMSFYEGSALEHYSRNPFLTLEFQCDRENVGWYGLHIEIRRDGADAMIHATKLAAPLLAKIQETKRNSPGEIMSAIKAPHWTEDGRCHKWMPIEDVQGPELKRYMSWTDGNCCVSTMAENEDDAKTNLLKEFAALIAKNTYRDYADKMGEWIVAGKPVKHDHYSRCPDTTPTAELLKPFKSQAEEPLVPALPQAEEAVAA